jgi:hypothetical protein
VLATVSEIEAQGFRDAGLHRLAERLKGTHESHHRQPVAPIKP